MRIEKISFSLDANEVFIFLNWFFFLGVSKKINWLGFVAETAKNVV